MALRGRARCQPGISSPRTSYPFTPFSQGDAAVTLFNPGAAQTVTVDLSSLPPRLLDGSVVPIDLVSNSTLPPLAASWSIEMDAGSVTLVGGFSLGVFAPRRGKKGTCAADDGYSRAAQASSLQGVREGGMRLQVTF